METPSIPPHEAFESKVAQLFREAGAEFVEHNKSLSGNQIDVVVTISVFGRPLVIAVECKNHREKVGVGRVNAFRTIVDVLVNNHAADWGIIVSPIGFTEDARKASEGGGCKVKLLVPEDVSSFASLQSYEGYVQELKGYLEAVSPIFVRASGHDLSTGAPVENLHDSLLDDLCRDSSPFTLLLGGIGCGKSTHMRQMAKSLCARHTAGDHTLVPLYISLDGYAGYSQLTLDRYITMELQRSYQRIQWSWYTLSKLRIQGQIVLFLDGLDEIKSLTTEDQFKRQVNHILDVIGGECRCVISCRSSAVESETGALSWFQRQIVERIPPRKINVLTVDPFTDAQIDEYLQLSHHEQLLASEVVQKHKPLWRRPILLKVAAECLGNPAYIGGLDSEEAALDFAVNRLLDYRPELLTLAGNAMSHSQWRELIENCALEMLLAKRRSFLPTELEAILRKDRVMTIDVASLDSIVMDTRLRTVFDLGRSGIEFGHIVFRDFLAAHALARKMLVVDERHDRIVGALLDADFLRFLRYAVKKLRPETELLQRLHQPRTAPPGPRTLQWIWIPPGLGLVGCHGENYNVRAKVSNWRRGFWISRTPISVGMFKECAAVSGEYGGIKVEDIEDFHDRSPLVNVSHSGATEIAKRMFIGRLPREDEWERAIGWIDGSYSGQGTESNASRTTPPYIGRNANHPWGLQDAPGSIWQWTDTQDRNSRQFVCKGAWWGATSAEKQDPWLRLIPTYAKHIRTGFRVVVDPSPHE